MLQFVKGGSFEQQMKTGYMLLRMAANVPPLLIDNANVKHPHVKLSRWALQKCEPFIIDSLRAWRCDLSVDLRRSAWQTHLLSELLPTPCAGYAAEYYFSANLLAPADGLWYNRLCDTGGPLAAKGR